MLFTDKFLDKIRQILGLWRSRGGKASRMVEADFYKDEAGKVQAQKYEDSMGLFGGCCYIMR